MKKLLAKILGIVMILQLAVVPTYAKDYITSVFLILNDGSPITAEQNIRLSLWSDGRIDDGDFASGVINTSAPNYSNYQTEVTITPDSYGRMKIALTALPNFPDIEPINQFLMIEYKDSGDPVTSYSNYKDIYINDTSMDRFPLVMNGPDIFDNIYRNNASTADIFILDRDDTAGAGDTIGLQFGSALAETLAWDIDNSRFSFSDALRVEGNLATIGQLYVADDHDAATSNGTINLGRDGSAWETLSWDTGNLQFNLSDDLNITGNLGLGTTTPNFNFHLYDTTSTAAHEWQVFDNGTDQASILTGTQDPTSVATDADTGSIFMNTSTGRVYTKADDGLTINWYPSGLDFNVYAALEGTFGTPDITNKFVTDSDPRLSAISGSFGEVALGTHLDYPATNVVTSNNYIIYTRIFLPSDTSVSSFAIFTTQAKTGNVNYGIYSNNDATDVGAPLTKLAEIGTTASTSPVNDWWLYSLSTPLEITEAGLYWLAYASDQSPKSHQFLGAEDVFIPIRVETKTTASTTLPTTANPDAKGSSYNIPYLAAFE